MELKDIRAITGLNATQFAKKYDIPRSTYIKWERPNNSPSFRGCPDYFLKLLERVVLLDYKEAQHYNSLETENICLWKIIEEHGLSREAHNYISSQSSKSVDSSTS